MNRTETILNKRVNISRLSTLLDYVDYRLFSECDDKRKLTMDHIYRQHVCKIMMILDNSNLNQRGRYNRTIRRKTYNIKIHGSFINNRSIYFCESRICYFALQCQSLKKNTQRSGNQMWVLCISPFSFLSSRPFLIGTVVPRTRTT